MIASAGASTLVRRRSNRDQIAVRVEHVCQRHGPVVGEHDRGVAPDLGDPVAQLVGVAQGGGQADEPDRRVEREDDLLPHDPAGAVPQVVDLVHDHAVEIMKRRRAAVDHVAQHLGGHHHDGRVRVDRVVACEQADVLGTEPLAELAELLIGQRLDRRGVEAASSTGERPVRRVLTDQGLARSCRGGDEQVPSGVQRGERLELEWVRGEALSGQEGLQEPGGVR